MLEGWFAEDPKLLNENDSIYSRLVDALSVDELRQVKLESADCRNSRCRLVIRVPTDDSIADVMIPIALARQFGSELRVWYGQNEDGIRTIYLALPGSTPPNFPAEG